MLLEDRSLTAEAAALARAIGATDESLPATCADHLARLVVHPLARLLLRVPRMRRLLVRLLEWAAPGLYAWHCLRTGYFDRQVRRALDAGVRQVVLLGAGLDTRATRLCGDVDGVTVFEVDRTTNAARKAASLADAGVATRATRRFVQATLGAAGSSLTEQLAAAGFDRSAPTFVLGEGLVMYLDEPARDALFEEIGSLADELTFAFDFVDTSAQAALADGSTRRLFASTHAVGETYRSGIDGDRLASWLGRSGLTLGERLGPRALAAREWGDRAPRYDVSSCSAVAVGTRRAARSGAASSPCAA